MSKPKRKIAVFITGGTIDSRNDPYMDGTTVPLQESLVKRYLESLPLAIDSVIKVICMKDSRSITENDRVALQQAIEDENAQYNIVTHGTYTMLDTARWLYAQKNGERRVIILTGSMGTLLGTIDEEGRLNPSDAQFNLGYAMAESLHAENGVYISMNGELFLLPDECWSHSSGGVEWKKNAS